MDNEKLMDTIIIYLLVEKVRQNKESERYKYYNLKIV